MARRRKHIRWLRQAGITILVLIIIALVGEWICRGLQDKILDPKQQPHHAFHPMVHHTFKPYLTKDLENPVGERVVVDINSMGLRERDVGPKETGEFRIVGLGGHLTASTHLPAADTYLKVLEKRIQAQGSRAGRCTTMNAAVNFYNLEQAYGLLTCMGKILEPDVVLVGLFVGDDVKAYQPDAGLPIPGKSFFKNRSYLYHVVRKAYRWARGGGVHEEPIVLDESQLPRWREIFQRYGDSREDERILSFVKSSRRELPLYSKGGVGEAALSGTALILDRIHERALSLGADLVLVLLPTRKQALGSEWAMTVELLEIEEDKIHLDQLQRELTRIAGRLKIPVIDLLPVFRAHPNPDSLYLRDRWLWNRDAQVVVAETIHEFLVGHGLLR